MSVCVFEVTAKRCVLCVLGLLDGVSQLEVRFWRGRRIGYRIQSLCSRKPLPRLRQNEELNVVCPPHV